MKDLLSAFIRRRKAIKYHLGSFEPRLGQEEEEGTQFQFVEVEARTLGGRATQISLKIWEDGETWFRLCHPNPRKQGGWAFNEAFRGSTAKLSGRETVELFEESLLGAHAPKDGAELRERIQKIWKDHLS